MPLKIIRSPSTDTLWRVFADGFLDALGDHTGPTGYPAFAWLTHRVQRDALYRVAAERGLSGWLQPPIAFFSDLPRLFTIDRRPIDALQRDILLDELVAEQGEALGRGSSSRLDRLGLEHAAASVFGELLPEGVTVDELERSLEQVAYDEFARTRNTWTVALYRAYTERLEAEGLYDPRAIHTMVSAQVAGGGLTTALGGARALHVYGLWSLGNRYRLTASLRDQDDVDVTLYLVAEEEDNEWENLGVPIEVIGNSRAQLRVVPAPDARRELEFVALDIKKRLVSDNVVPHDVAVVARMGHIDSWEAHRRLTAAGIPVTARLRSALAEVPALKAILALFRGAANGWPYRPLRQALENSYFDIDVDLRSVDWIASSWRIEGLANWGESLEHLGERVSEGEEAQALKRDGLYPDRLGKDCEAFNEFRDRVLAISPPRPVKDWIGLTRELLDPGWFGFRRRLCRDDGEHWDVVRLDQQAVEYLHGMLRGWADAEHGADEIGVDEWYRRLRRLLNGSEIAVSTPMRNGVQVLEAHEAALVPFAHTYVVHANEGVFPKASRPGMLFTDEEREQLLAGGLRVTTRDLVDRRERTLWHAVTGGPNVTISYRTADANGVPLLPALVVPEHDDADEIPRTQFVWPEAVNPIQATRRAMRDLRDHRRAGGSAVIDTPRPDLMRHAILSAHAESQRRASRDGNRVAGELGPWNGEIRDPVALDRLAKRFGPDRLWSASQLEQYAGNPFLFFVDRVLYLKELEEAEESTTALVKGSLAHEMLERFHRSYDGGYPTDLTKDVRRLFDEVVATVFAEAERSQDTWLGRPALWTATKEDLHEKVGRYLEWELPRLTNRVPVEYELRFGFDDRPPFVLSGRDVVGVETEMLLRGKVDRVDRASTGAHYVLDYKSGGTPNRKGYLDGGALQGPIYMVAVADALRCDVEEAAYFSLKKTIKKKSYTGEATVKFGSTEYDCALTLALSIPERVRAGKFEPRAAASIGQWLNYWIGADVCRVTELHASGECRFDE